MLAALERFTFISLRDLRVLTAIEPIGMLRATCHRLVASGRLKRIRALGTGRRRKLMRFWLYALPHHEPMVKVVQRPAWEQQLIDDEREWAAIVQQRRERAAMQYARRYRYASDRAAERGQALRALWEEAALEAAVGQMEATRVAP